LAAPKESFGPDQQHKKREVAGQATCYNKGVLAQAGSDFYITSMGKGFLQEAREKKD